MRTLKSFMTKLKKDSIICGGFEDRGVFGKFNKQDDKDIVICYANYYEGWYEGNATVLYYRKSTKKYYEAYGSHCSCMGLEGQWDGDEEIVFAELEQRMLKGYLYDENKLLEAFQTYMKG